MILRKIKCWIFGHTYHIQQTFGPQSRRVVCLHCDGDWGMNDRVRAFIPWSGELEDVYRTMGYRILKR